MSNNFGDTFVDSYKFGTKIAQDEQQHAQAVAMEEEKLAATQAMEAVKMEALNKQIDIAERERQDKANFQYDTTLNERSKTFNLSYVPMGENQYTKALNIKPLSKDQLRNSFPGVEMPEGTYVDSQSGQVIAGLIAYDRQLAAQQAAINKANAPIVEADTLSAEFDKRSLPSMTIKKDVETMPSFYNGMTNAIDQTINLLPGIHLQSIKSPLGDGNLEVPWIGYTKQQEKTIPNYFKNIGEGFTKPRMEQREVSNVEGIKQYLNDQAKTIGKMIPRASGEKFPLYGSSIGTYTNVAEQLLRVDEEGNPSFDISGLSTEAAKTALYTVAFTHRQNYMGVMAEAQNEFKMSADKEEAQKKFEQTMAEAKKQFPLYNQTIGQSFGQKYAK